MKIAICIASHERTLPLNIVLRCLPAEWHAVVVVSTPRDAAAVMARPNTHVHLFPNEPLGAKWQHAVDKARALQPDVLGITGSDDVLLTSTEAIATAMERYDFIGLNSFHIYDGKEHHKCGYRTPVIPLGGGRFYGRALLERMRWQLFDPARGRKLDDQGFANARRAGARVYWEDDLPGLTLMALKGPWKQMNPMAKLRAHDHKLYLIPKPHLKRMGDYQF